MKIRLITIAHKLPDWVQSGFQEYGKRLPLLEWIRIPAKKRTHHDRKKIKQEDSDKLLAHTKPQHRLIVLDIKGNLWSTEQLAELLKLWQQDGKTIDLLIGGPEGLSAECLSKAEFRWSLSPLTFPHILVPIIVAEQLYRAHTILQNHPYHRI